MAVWKPDLSGRDPSLNTAGCGARLDHFVDLLAAAPDDAGLREQLGNEMEGAGVSRHGGWVLEFRIRDARTMPGQEVAAAAWLTARGSRVPKGRRAGQMLAKEIQRHVLADGEDWPPSDVFKWDVVWTARPSRRDASV